MAYEIVPIEFKGDKVGKKESADVITNKKTARALAELVKEIGEMPLIKGIPRMDALAAIYQQGLKDGARRAFRALDAAVEGVKDEIPYKKPGRPASKRKKKKQ